MAALSLPLQGEGLGLSGLGGIHATSSVSLVLRTLSTASPRGEAYARRSKDVRQYPILAIPLCSIAGSIPFPLQHALIAGTLQPSPSGEGGPLAVDEGGVSLGMEG